jgi:AcrR family transcriptional regulator
MVVEGPNTKSTASVPVALVAGRRRRRDAERNRDHVLKVARRLLQDRGLAAMTMDQLAAEAGVGKGTLYRGFRSRAGLAEALLDEAERQLQERILTGPPPLGWGAPPDERLRAFFLAYVQLLAANVDLLVETERGAPGARFHTGAYAFWHAHITALLRTEHQNEPEVRAHALLALLSADLYRHLREARVHTAQIEAVILDLLAANTSPSR